jgi:hypothetical protein
MPRKAGEEEGQGELHEPGFIWLVWLHTRHTYTLHVQVDVLHRISKISAIEIFFWENR